MSIYLTLFNILTIFAPYYDFYLKPFYICGMAGRPNTYDHEIAMSICEITSISSKSLKTICEELNLRPRTVLDWLASNNEFSQMYARSKAEQADLLAEEILEIADDDSGDLDYIDEKTGRRVENKEFVNRSRLKVDARKWIASKLKPKKYGDKIEATVNASEGVRMILGNKLPGEDEIKSENDG